MNTVNNRRVGGWMDGWMLGSMEEWMVDGWQQIAGWENNWMYACMNA